jgi:hypothetical protein
MTYYRIIQLNFSALFSLTVYMNAFQSVKVSESNFCQFARFFYGFGGSNMKFIVSTFTDHPHKPHRDPLCERTYIIAQIVPLPVFE